MRRLLTLALAAALALPAGPAPAQNFFERLFGIAPSRPEPPPTVAPPGLPAPPLEERRTAPPPQPARPTAIRTPDEGSAFGRDLKQNGSSGSLRLERTAGGAVRLKLSVVGRRPTQSAETCAVALGGAEGVPLQSLGRPDGIARYQMADAACPMTLDLLDEAVLVKGPAEACTFPTASCQVDPSGMWGPEPGQLAARARDFEATRGSADKAVRDNYKVMAQRARPDAVRPIVAEQAAFSSDREMVCRSYAREGAHSFCNARYTEARAIALATKLGVTTVTASTQPAPEPRRRRDPMEAPPTSEIMRGGVTDVPNE